VYAPGQTKPLRQLKQSGFACLLALGAVRGVEYLFLPSCSGNDVVSAYKHDKSSPSGSTNVNVNPLIGAAIKPAGVP